MRATTAPLEQYNSCRDLHVQLKSSSRHENDNQYVAVLLDCLVQTFALSPKHQRGRYVVLDRIVQFQPAFVESIDPEPLLLETLESLGYICHARDGQVFQGARGGALHGLRQGRGPPLRNDDGRS